MLNKKNKGITLIALVITIIILLILAGISISMLTGQNGILNRAQEAKVKNEKSQAQEEVTIALNYLQIENETSSTTLTQENKRKILEDELKKSAKDSTVIISGNGYKVNHRKYDFYIDENLKLIEDEKEFDTTEWDKTAAPEYLFIWKSNDPNNSEYGTVIGYNKNIDNYTILKYPTRCTKIEASYQDNYGYEEDETTVRSFTKNIVKIEMPNTITEIGTAEFSGYYWGHGFHFNNLEKIELSKSLESIPSYTFNDCKKLKNIEIPNSVTSIGDYAFNGCTGLTDVKIPDSVTTIGISAFNGCTGLTDVKIPDSVTSIGNYAFNGCTGLTDVKIPDSVTSIGACAFSDCTGLTDVKIPDSVTSIRYRAFDGCTGLKDVKIPNSVTTIESQAFDDCTGLKDVKIPDSVTSIGNYAFAGCTGLTDVKIPDRVTSIGVSAFENVAHITYTGSATGSPWGAKSRN